MFQILCVQIWHNQRYKWYDAVKCNDQSDQVTSPLNAEVKAIIFGLGLA